MREVSVSFVVGRVSEGEDLLLPIPIALQGDASSGPQPVRLDFEISGQGNARFSVYRTLQLGLDDVQVELPTQATIVLATGPPQ